MRLRVAFDAFAPVARWGALFHVLLLERPEVRLEWEASGFPTQTAPLLDGADVGLFVHPPHDDRLSYLTVETSSMVVLTAVGHPLAQHDELSVADVLDQPFPGGPELRPDWVSFWTLDDYRGGRPDFGGDGVAHAGEAVELVGTGRAVATLPAWMADAVPHPGVIAIPLKDGPPVTTQLVWHADREHPAVDGLVDLARAWTDGQLTSEPRPYA